MIKPYTVSGSHLKYGAVSWEPGGPTVWLGRKVKIFSGKEFANLIMAIISSPFKALGLAYFSVSGAAATTSIFSLNLLFYAGGALYGKIKNEPNPVTFATTKEVATWFFQELPYMTLTGKNLNPQFLWHHRTEPPDENKEYNL